LPAANPYEWQLLCEHVAAATRQLGSVRVRVAGVECIARREERGAERRCAECGRSLVQVSFRMAWRDLCRDCAQLSLAAPGDAVKSTATTRASR
jgi:hypothetical protein